MVATRLILLDTSDLVLNIFLEYADEEDFSQTRIGTERKLQRELRSGGIFFTGRAAGESLQRELVRGVWGA